MSQSDPPSPPPTSPEGTDDSYMTREEWVAMARATMPPLTPEQRLSMQRRRMEYARRAGLADTDRPRTDSVSVDPEPVN